MGGGARTRCLRSGARGPQPGCGLAGALEARGRALARRLLRNRPPQRLDPLAFGCQRRIGGELPLDLERVSRIELAIDIGVNEQARIAGRCHQPPFASSVATRSISRRRARASRDMTVPMGTLVT